MKYRKKPVVIEAMKLTRNFADVVVDWIGKETPGGTVKGIIPRLEKT